jgi:hypothetical protein
LHRRLQIGALAAEIGQYGGRLRSQQTRKVLMAMRGALYHARRALRTFRRSPPQNFSA